MIIVHRYVFICNNRQRFEACKNVQQNNAPVNNENWLHHDWYDRSVHKSMIGEVKCLKALTCAYWTELGQVEQDTEAMKKMNWAMKDQDMYLHATGVRGKYTRFGK